MKAIIQRVAQASVIVNQEERCIGRGLVVLVGVGENDTKEDARRLSDKILSLRIFPNEQGKFDRSLLDINGELLVVSQFTLFGDASRGRRPDFTAAARPEKAVPLYETLIGLLRASDRKVVTGEFGADMMVDIRNDGPVTIIYDTTA